MENIAVICECDYEENNLIKKCKYCIDTPYEVEIKTLRNLLSSMDHIILFNERLERVRQIFEYIITCSNFMASQPGFRRSVINKLTEFRLCDQCSSLHYLFDKVDVFLISIQTNIYYID